LLRLNAVPSGATTVRSRSLSLFQLSDAIASGGALVRSQTFRLSGSSEATHTGSDDLLPGLPRSSNATTSSWCTPGSIALAASNPSCHESSPGKSGSSEPTGRTQ